MYPLTFSEFIQALGLEILGEHLPVLKSIKKPIPPSIHNRLMELLRIYFSVGGMPQSVERFQQTRSLNQVDEVHQDLCNSYLQSFSQFNKLSDIDSMKWLFGQIPNQIGNKIMYKNLDPQRRIEKTKRALHILEISLYFHKIFSVSADTIPLGTTRIEKVFKYLFLDLGLMKHLCGLKGKDIMSEPDLMNLLKGAMAEQFIGQELLAHSNGSENNALYYWSRTQKNSRAEIDYLLNKEEAIYPIDVKNGPAGKLKSIIIFKKEHLKSGTGLIFHSSNYVINVEYDLKFLPLYTILK